MQRSAIHPPHSHSIVHGEDSDDSEDELAAASSGSEADVLEHEHESSSLMHTASRDLDSSKEAAELAEPTAEETESQGMLPRDKQRRTTHYNYALEKQMSHVEAKQFFQHQRRHQHRGYLHARGAASTRGAGQDGSSVFEPAGLREDRHALWEGWR
jgi:AMP deaminase